MLGEGGIVNCNANEKNGLVFLLWEQGRTYMIFYSMETEDKKYSNMSLYDRSTIIFLNKTK